MSYLCCPNCGYTVFDRNPLEAPRVCGRCCSRGHGSFELRRVRSGGAAASVLAGQAPPRTSVASRVNTASADEDGP